jgi:DNA repair protein RadC
VKEYFRPAMQYMNALGGGILLDMLDTDEIRDVFVDYISQLYNKDKTQSIFIKTEDTYEFIHRYYKGKLNEELYLISLTPNNHIIRCEKVVEGTGAQAKVTIRKITDMMSRNRVNNVIITHNHPNGSAVPSYEDDQITQALVASLAINDSFLLDHLIVSDDGFYSYRRAGKIESYKNKIKDFLTNRIAQNEAPYEVDYDQE